MIFEWLSNKMRFLADVLFVVLGGSVLLLPWYFSVVIFSGALFVDFLAYSFMKKGAAE